MKTSKKMSVVLAALLLGAACAGAMAGCSKDKDKGGSTVHETLVNGGFEQGVGDLTGWKSAGSAFSKYGVVNSDKIGNVSVGKVGNNFFSGYDAGNPQFTGSLTSETFKLGGTGMIGFLLGAGKNAEKCYVEFFEEGKDEALLKVANTAFNAPYLTDQLVRNVADLSAHKGKNIYIKVTDEDKGPVEEYAYVNLDDFIVYETEAEATAALKEREDTLKENGAPEFDETETDTAIKNGGFEDGLNNWMILEGEAFSKACVTDSSEKFWGTRDYNAVGEKFLCGYQLAESATGAIRSTKFTLAGEGIISLLLAGSPQEDVYVAVCDAETDAELYTVSHANDFVDPEMSENMVRKYIDASASKGKVLYIKIVDKAKAGPFGAIVVDDIKVSMTKEETTAQMKADYEWSLTLGNDGVGKATKAYYSNYPDYPYELEAFRFKKTVANAAIKASAQKLDLTAYLEEAEAQYGSVSESEFSYRITKAVKGSDVITSGFDAFDVSGGGVISVTYEATYQNKVIEENFKIEITDANHIKNGGFELGNLAGWTYTEGTGDGQIGGANAVISDTIWWGERLPYNQSGEYHFDGWKANATEANTYKLTSSTFTLGGSGYISFKMGGNAAAVKVYKADGTQIALYKNTAFADVAFPNLDQGCRLATMTTFVADLSDHLGEELYIELCDTKAEGWAIAMFDEILTYYETAPVVAEKSDRVQFYKMIDMENKIQETTPTDYDIPWVTAVNVLGKSA